MHVYCISLKIKYLHGVLGDSACIDDVKQIVYFNYVHYYGKH